MRSAFTLTLGALFSLLLVGCQTTNTPPNSKPYFVEAGADIIPFEQRKRRKWDNAVIADLDRDGLSDLVTTEHGAAIRIFWNLGGRFSEPQTILRRDTHGVAAADFDNDGKVEIIVVQGGGNGKKPKYPILFEVSSDRKVTRSDPYRYFEFTRGRAGKFLDANNDGKL